MKFTQKARELAEAMIKSNDSDSLYFYTNEVEGGLTLGIGTKTAEEGDRVCVYDGVKVVCEEMLDAFLAEFEFDEEDGDFVIDHSNEHEHGDDCCCGGHDEEDGCGCGGHHHHHHHHHHGEGECCCGEENEEKQECGCGCGEHHHA